MKQQIGKNVIINFIFLDSKSGPTNLQIMHIEKCDPKGIDVIVDNVTYIPDNMDVVNEEGKNLSSFFLRLQRKKID